MRTKGSFGGEHGYEGGLGVGDRPGAGHRGIGKIIGKDSEI